MLGDRTRAGRVFSAALDALAAERDQNVSRADFGSRLRDAAAVLTLIAEADPAKGGLPGDAIVRAADALSAARKERTLLSTQEMNWMVLAAAALSEKKMAGAFDLNGKPVSGALYRFWDEEAFNRAPVQVANAGDTPADLIVTASGAPVEPEAALSHGYEIDRSFFKLDGTKADLSNLKQNDRVVIALKVTETEARYARLLIVDRLPAGLEIDNPALVDSASLDAFAWVTNDAPVEHTEYRDDRFVAVLSRAPGQSAFINLAYVARAVAPGRYVQPPATAEDMYNPERFGRTAFGQTEVKAR